MLTYENPKLNKSKNYGYQSFGLSLAPNLVSGYQVCPKATVGCSTSCIYYSGMGAMGKTQRARIKRTRLFFEHREKFLRLLLAEMQLAIEIALTNSLEPCFRLNVTSDIAWEKFDVPQTFPEVQFYDYTKIFGRTVPPNYHLTFSRSETNAVDVGKALEAGMNIAVPFFRRPSEYLGLPVIDGDINDLRFLDPKQVVVGLVPKGRARVDTTGFIV